MHFFLSVLCLVNSSYLSFPDSVLFAQHLVSLLGPAWVSLLILWPESLPASDLGITSLVSHVSGITALRRLSPENHRLIHSVCLWLLQVEGQMPSLPLEVQVLPTISSNIFSFLTPFSGSPMTNTLGSPMSTHNSLKLCSLYFFLLGFYFFCFIVGSWDHYVQPHWPFLPVHLICCYSHPIYLFKNMF